MVLSRGLCSKHGGGKRCLHTECKKAAVSGGQQMCFAHGGGKFCLVENCESRAAKGGSGDTKGMCSAHGGGKRCSHVGCTAPVHGNKGLCIPHGGAKSKGARPEVQTGLPAQPAVIDITALQIATDDGNPGILYPALFSANVTQGPSWLLNMKQHWRSSKVQRIPSEKI